MERSASVMTQTHSFLWVGAGNPQTFTQRDLILAAVEGTELSPVTSRMTSQIVEGVSLASSSSFKAPGVATTRPRGRGASSSPPRVEDDPRGLWSDVRVPSLGGCSARQDSLGTLAASSSLGPIRPHLPRASSENQPWTVAPERLPATPGPTCASHLVDQVVLPLQQPRCSPALPGPPWRSPQARATHRLPLPLQPRLDALAVEGVRRWPSRGGR